MSAAVRLDRAAFLAAKVGDHIYALGGNKHMVIDEILPAEGISLRGLVLINPTDPKKEFTRTLLLVATDQLGATDDTVKIIDGVTYHQDAYYWGLDGKPVATIAHSCG